MRNDDRPIIKMILRFLNIINKMIPKSKKKILVFNRMPALQNNYAIFNYLIENGYNEKYKILYYMPEIENHIDKTKNVKAKFSLKGALFHYLTSQYVFLDTGNIRIKPSKSQCVMNLWHGVPFKSIGYMSKDGMSTKDKNAMNAFSQIIVPSNSMTDIYKDSFNINDGQVFYSGQPRNDYLKEEIEPFELLNINRKEYKKIIMWMTTYRVRKDGRASHTSNSHWSDTGLPLLTDMKNLKSINTLLERENILLIIKYHTIGKGEILNTDDLKNIKIIDEDDFIEAKLHQYHMLGKCDALITDYSSVFIDYLLVDKPIGFIIDDIDDYKKSNGFNFEDPLKYMPGMHMKSIDDLTAFIDNLTREEDNYREERKEVSAFFNEFNQENNRQYVLDFMGISLEDQ